MLSFADDVRVAGVQLEEEIESVETWTPKWDLPLNLAKC